MTDQETMTPETCPACGSDEAATRGVMMDWPTKGQGGVPCSHPWHAVATPPLPVREPSQAFEQMKSDVAKIFASSEASGAERKAAWDQIVALCAAPVQEFRDQYCRVSRISAGHIQIEVLVDNVVDLTIVQNRTLMFRRADLPLVHVAAQPSAPDASAVTREAVTEEDIESAIEIWRRFDDEDAEFAIVKALLEHDRARFCQSPPREPTTAGGTPK